MSIIVPSNDIRKSTSYQRLRMKIDAESCKHHFYFNNFFSFEFVYNIREAPQGSLGRRPRRHHLPPDRELPMCIWALSILYGLHQPRPQGGRRLPGCRPPVRRDHEVHVQVQRWIFTLHDDRQESHIVHERRAQPVTTSISLVYRAAARVRLRTHRKAPHLKPVHGIDRYSPHGPDSPTPVSRMEMAGSSSCLPWSEGPFSRYAREITGMS